MFYSQTSIDCLKRCPGCQEEYQRPFMLPCGQTVCQHCILKSKRLKSEVILCSFCSDSHAIPSNGFPINKMVLELLKIKPEEIHRSDAVDKLKNLLKIIQIKVVNLHNDIQKGKETIHKHFSIVKNDIQIRTDQLVEQIQNFNKELTNEANEQELKCIENYTCNAKTDVEINCKSLNILDFCTIWSNYLNESKINDNEVDDALKLAESHLEKINEEEGNFLAKIFNNKIPVFEKSKKPFDKARLLGSLKFIN